MCEIDAAVAFGAVVFEEVAKLSEELQCFSGCRDEISSIRPTSLLLRCSRPIVPVVSVVLWSPRHGWRASGMPAGEANDR